MKKKSAIFNDRIKGFTKENSSYLKLIAAVLLSAGIFLAFFQPARIYGQSMMPTLEDHSLALNIRTAWTGIKCGDIISFKNENTGGSIYIKRIVGIPGDTVQIICGYLYRNGKKVNEEFEPMAYAGLLENPVTLGEGEYIVLGDNRNNSRDSRMIGVIRYEDIICKYLAGIKF